MKKVIPARVYGYVARKANQVVVLRQGPHRVCQMLVWDLATDVVTPGQWVRAHVFFERCDVSPDGKYFVAALSDYSTTTRSRGSAPEELRTGWTAISRPPYFSALALWFSGCSWNGGGVWNGNRRVALNNYAGAWHEEKAAEGLKPDQLDDR
jgi:hypothetical protein